ncbi:MAG: NAD(P)-dependent oxidoreductase [Limnohabitans sp.]|nr:NAD(P)-dependent oxidoreductase [Limnohabitans sp.]
MTGVVGVIGVGNMGGAMARNLLAQGYTVHVHDIDPAQMHLMRDAGAVIHDSPSAVSTSASLIIIAVVDALQVDQVISGEGGLGPTLTPDHTLMLCPTISPQDVERFAQQIHSLGASVMDAPMSGGPARAQAGTMSLMLACDASVYARHAAVLQVLSNQIFRISNQPGDGAKTKLVNNLLAGINLVGAAEVLVLAERMGLSAQTTLEVMAQSSGQSWISSDRMTRALAEHLTPLAHMSLLTKDTRLACDAARDAKVHVPLGQQASDIFAKACEAGWRDKDDAALLHFLRQLN